MKNVSLDNFENKKKKLNEQINFNHLTFKIGIIKISTSVVSFNNNNLRKKNLQIS